jgi:hypothetical protein
MAPKKQSSSVRKPVNRKSGGPNRNRAKDVKKGKRSIRQNKTEYAKIRARQFKVGGPAAALSYFKKNAKFLARSRKFLRDHKLKERTKKLARSGK